MLTSFNTQRIQQRFQGGNIPLPIPTTSEIMMDWANADRRLDISDRPTHVLGRWVQLTDRIQGLDGQQNEGDKRTLAGSYLQQIAEFVYRFGDHIPNPFADPLFARHSPEHVPENIAFANQTWEKAHAILQKPMEFSLEKAAKLSGWTHYDAAQQAQYFNERKKHF